MRCSACSGRSHPPSDDIAGFSAQDPRRYYRSPDEIATVFAPLLPSLARLRDLETLNLSGALAGVMLREICTFVAFFTAHAQAAACNIWTPLCLF
jgi:hypothetical protein